jgi:hypothetical protein
MWSDGRFANSSRPADVVEHAAAQCIDYPGQSGCPSWQMMTATPRRGLDSRNLSYPGAMIKLCP